MNPTMTNISIWPLFWHVLKRFVGVRSGICSDTLYGTFSGIFFDMLSSDILSGISFGILSDILLSGIFSAYLLTFFLAFHLAYLLTRGWGSSRLRSGGEHRHPALAVEVRRRRTRRRRKRRTAADIKSNNPHLTGGEQNTTWVYPSPQVKLLTLTAGKLKPEPNTYAPWRSPRSFNSCHPPVGLSETLWKALRFSRLLRKKRIEKQKLRCKLLPLDSLHMSSLPYHPRYNLMPCPEQLLTTLDQLFSLHDQLL